jgi:hypothetical protein
MLSAILRRTLNRISTHRWREHIKALQMNGHTEAAAPMMALRKLYAR